MSKTPLALYLWPLLVLVLLVVLSILFLWGLSWFLLWSSGYLALGRSHHWPVLPQGLKLTPVALRLGWVHFNFTIKLSLRPEGLYMSVRQIFRVAGPRYIFVPWEHIKIVKLGPQHLELSLGVKRMPLKLYFQRPAYDKMRQEIELNRRRSLT